jgi:hypothetical protein
MAGATKDHDLLIRIEEIVKRIEGKLTLIEQCQDLDNRRIDNLEKNDAVKDGVIAQLRIDINKDVTAKNWTSGIITLIASVIAAIFGVNLKP